MTTSRIDDHARRVRQMFSAIAGRYDFLNRILSLGLDRRWRRAAVRSLTPGDDALILDVCAGTGELAEAFLQRSPRARVVVLDFSEPMLRIALRHGRPRADHFSPLLADALALPFLDRTFDALGCAFGVRNLSSLDRGFREFHRVLRPGAPLCILEFTREMEGSLGRALRWYVRRMVPFLGGVLSGNPSAYRYLSRSIAAFLRNEEVARSLARSGFECIRHRPLSFGACSLITAVRGRAPAAPHSGSGVGQL